MDIIIGLILLSVVLCAVTWASFEVGTVETSANTEVKAMFDDSQFGELKFEEVTVDYNLDNVIFGDPADITVVVAHGPNAQFPPDVAQRIDDRLTKTTGEDIVVDVEFVQG